MSSWTKSRDPQTYGLLKFDASAMTEFISKYRKETGIKLTTTHILCKALAKAIDEHPEINCIIRGSHLYQRESVDIFMQVSLDEEGKDLSGLVVKNAPHKRMEEIIQQVQQDSKSLREGKDKTFKKVKKSIKLTPLSLMRATLNLLDFILYRLNIWSPLLGVQKDPFASAMISNVSQFGVEHGFVPIPAISHIPLILAIFATKDEPVVKEGEIVIQKTMTIGVTLDHRVIDGVYAGKITKALRYYISHPEKL